jgi:hypothetical protein
MNNSFKGKRAKSVVLQLEDPGWTTPKLVKRLPPIPPPGDPRRYLWARVLLYLGALAIVVATVVIRLWGKMAIR